MVYYPQKYNSIWHAMISFPLTWELGGSIPELRGMATLLQEWRDNLLKSCNSHLTMPKMHTVNSVILTSHYWKFESGHQAAGNMWLLGTHGLLCWTKPIFSVSQHKREEMDLASVPHNTEYHWCRGSHLESTHRMLFQSERASQNGGPPLPTTITHQPQWA